jgi:hypothetical protein
MMKAMLFDHLLIFDEIWKLLLEDPKGLTKELVMMMMMMIFYLCDCDDEYTYDYDYDYDYDSVTIEEFDSHQRV